MARGEGAAARQRLTVAAPCGTVCAQGRHSSRLSMKKKSATKNHTLAAKVGAAASTIRKSVLGLRSFIHVVASAGSTE